MTDPYFDTFKCCVSPILLHQTSLTSIGHTRRRPKACPISYRWDLTLFWEAKGHLEIRGRSTHWEYCAQECLKMKLRPASGAQYQPSSSSYPCFFSFGLNLHFALTPVSGGRLIKKWGTKKLACGTTNCRRPAGTDGPRLVVGRNYSVGIKGAGRVNGD